MGSLVLVVGSLVVGRVVGIVGVGRRRSRSFGLAGRRVRRLGGWVGGRLGVRCPVVEVLERVW